MNHASYLVLARKYRPQTFDEMIGQEHITDLLKNSMSTNRLAHAFLFCGPRGIGKTSLARILAKSLNCQKGPTLAPCGQCSACQEIAQGNSFDVLEIDGASNRGIDEIRTLRENVKFAPSYGRYKIYIVDEVHMLTTEAFNALLKTLEEPPAHVKFIFATTAVSKVPSTIISRCQRFDFKRISVPLIMGTLAGICQKEKFKVDQDALFAVAKAAQGSLRDALSILDQVSAISERNILAHDVFSMLGLVETQFLFDLADCIAQKDCEGALKTIDNIIGQGKDIKQLGKELVEHFRNVMVIKVGGKSLGGLVDYPVATKEMLLTQSEKFSLKEILQIIEIFIETQDLARITESWRIPLEFAFAKLIYQQEGVHPGKNPGVLKADSKNPNDEMSARVPAASKVSPMAVLKNQKGQVDFSIEENKLENGAGCSEDLKESDPVSSHENGEALDLEKVKRSWDAITYAISREKMSAATYLQEGSPYELKGSVLVIGFSKEASFQKESLGEKNILRLIEKVFSDKLRTDLKIELRVIENYKPQEDEPLVKSALDTFKGKVISKWHKE